MTQQLNDGFDQPQPVDDVLLAFPGDVRDLMPAMEDIPEEFRDRNSRSEWNLFVRDWFFSSNHLETWDLYPREGVDADQAYRHLSAVIRSFQPKHEHKEAAVAWLLSRWFDRVEANAAAPDAAER